MDLLATLTSDKDLLIIAAAAFILWKSGADIKLILVLAYVFLLN